MGEEKAIALPAQVWRLQTSCWVTSGLWRYRLPDCTRLKVGQVYRPIGILKPSTADQNHWQKELTVQSIDLVEPPTNSLLYWRSLTVRLVDQFSRWLFEPIRSLVSYPEEVLAESFILGSGVELPEQMSRSVKIMGIAHVIAVSGSHLSLLMAMILPMLSGLKKSHRTLLLLLLLTMYTTFVGWQAPVTRAWLMVIILLIGKAVFGRHASLLDCLLWTIVLFLLIDPWVVLQIGWQMSVLATLGIVLVYPVLRRYCPDNWLLILPASVRQVVTGTLEAFLASVASLLLLAPLLIQAFGVWSWGSLLSSLLLWWFFPLLISSTFFGVLTLRTLSLLGMHQAILSICSAVLLEIPLKLLVSLFEWVEQFAWLLMPVPKLSPLVMAGWYGGVAALVLIDWCWQTARRRRRQALLQPLRHCLPGGSLPAWEPL